MRDINLCPPITAGPGVISEVPQPTRPQKKSRKRSKSAKKNSSNCLPDPEYDCSKLCEELSLDYCSVSKGKFFKRYCRGEKRIRIYSFIEFTIPVVFYSGKDRKEGPRTSVYARKFFDSKINDAICSRIATVKITEKIAKKPKKIPRYLKTKLVPFPDYMDRESVSRGLRKGELVKGFLRINPNSKECYVNNLDASLQDYVITSMQDRNRAMDGDEVVLKLKPESEWKERQITASVVAIHQMIHSRLAVGHLKLMPDKNRTYAAFTPRDGRIPRIRVSSTSWPPDFYNNSAQYENVLFLVKIIEWSDVRFALGTILENIGINGDLKAETKAILLEYELDVSPYTHSINQFLSFPEVSEDEMEIREDWRNECVFTIDPETARDLDDALSCKLLENGNFQVGVHISDVSFYLETSTPVDDVVNKKATTVYLVDSTYHMLPLEMCQHCSLLPGQDKRALSVIWELTQGGKIVATRFCRTLVHSCAKFSYEQAQKMIENPTDLDMSDLPVIHGPFSAESLSECVNRLQKFAAILRNERFKNGALRLDQPKLAFQLDPLTGEPQNWSVYELTDAHRMIEEFMLLANMHVAQKLVQDYPELAFLRRHESPKETMLREVQQNLEIAGIFIEVSSAGALQASLKKYDSEDYLSRCRFAVLTHLLTKPMKRANYFCVGTASDQQSYMHYALNVPLYTHFTSPIRRYADIMVHRLLAGSLNYCEKPNWDVDYVEKVATNCNKQKYNAKRAGDASCELYLAYFVEKHQPYVQTAIVANVREKYFEVLVLSCGSALRVFANDFDESIACKVSPSGNVAAEELEGDANPRKPNTDAYKYEVTFPPENNGIPECTIVIERFALVSVSLRRKEKTNKLSANLVRPLPTVSFGNKQKYYD